jgi:hypothetical protein
VGLFDFLFPEPTIDAFADLFIHAMRRAGVTSELVYEKDNCRIVRRIGEETQVVNLRNFFRESLALPRYERKKHLSRVVEAVLTLTDVPEDARGLCRRAPGDELRRRNHGFRQGNSNRSTLCLGVLLAC